MSANLATILTDSSKRDPAKIALKLDDLELPYGALDEASARVAGLLAERGVASGDRVGLMLPNVPYFAAIYYGILRLGAVVVPMNVLLKEREVGFYLTDPGAKHLFAWYGFAEAAQTGADEAGAECILVTPGEFEQLLGAVENPFREVVEKADDDTAVILYTSGTTGTPKGAELTHSNLLSNVKAATSLFDLGPDGMMLGALPLFHSFGQTCALNSTIFVGGTLTLIPRFEPGKALEIMQRDKVNIFEGVPTMFSAMLHHPGAGDFDLVLELCASGGSAMPVEVMKAFEEKFGCPILEGYGLSETSPVASFNHRDRERKPGTIGTPIVDVEFKLLKDDGTDSEPGEVGEIAIKGPNVMKGYWNRPDATAEAIVDGWFKTGDMATVDEDGYYAIVDRKKDMIIRGGYNVYPREIEEVIYEHPAVREAAVVAVPHTELGEDVGAAIALKDGEDVSADELRAFVKEHVAAYKYPRTIWFVDELPKGPTGKILKREIEIPKAAEAPPASA